MYKGAGASGAKVLRLAFHDCRRYTDGSGGCDGCLNWEGVGAKINEGQYSLANPPVDKTNNNGLQATVEDLEELYTDPAYPSDAPVLAVSLKDSGKSRADLWSYAAIVAVEYSIGVNNIACTDVNDPRVPSKTCMHSLGEEECFVTPERNLEFQYGRADCIGYNSTHPYIATQSETQPSAIANGKDTVKFFKENFDFTGRETAAIFGAHSFGSSSVRTSLFPYLWTSKGKNTLNNDYYKNIVGQKRWFYDDVGCTPLGTAYNEAPETRWLAHTRKMDQRGGPIFWIHQYHTCPNKFKNEGGHLNGEEVDCVNNAPEGQVCVADPADDESSTPRKQGEADGDVEHGCEQFKVHPGTDEIALNVEMGLYRDFEVTDGVIHGCPGLEIFNETMTEDNGKPVWSGPSGKYNQGQQPDCGLQQLSEPEGSQPLYQIMEEFANNQTSWINDFYGALEKMMQNGYTSLNNLSFDRFENVDCPWPDQTGDFVLCYVRSEVPSDAPIFVIGSELDDLSGQVYQYNTVTEEFDFAEQTGATNQQWRLSSSGSQIYNVLTDQPLVVGGNYEWTVQAEGDSVMIISVDGSAVDCKRVPCRLNSNVTGKKQQKFNYTIIG
jgi:hypothetical protein